eukprot:Rmarinus@m.1395
MNRTRGRTYERFDDIETTQEDETRGSEPTTDSNPASSTSQPNISSAGSLPHLMRNRGIHVICGCCRVTLEAPAGCPVVQCFQCRSILQVPQPFLTVCSVCHTQLMTPPGSNLIQCGNCRSFLSVQHPTPFQQYGSPGVGPGQAGAPAAASGGGKPMVVVQNPGGDGFPDVSLGQQVAGSQGQQADASKNSVPTGANANAGPTSAVETSGGHHPQDAMAAAYAQAQAHAAHVAQVQAQGTAAEATVGQQ